jgi:hypothetical protein
MSEESVTTTTSDTSLASDASCAVCRSSKIERNCDLCDSEVCKKCLHFLAEGTFAFWAELPGELSFTHYCTTCHAEHVETALEKFRCSVKRRTKFSSKTALIVMKRFCAWRFKPWSRVLAGSLTRPSSVRKFVTKAIRSHRGVAQVFPRRSISSGSIGRIKRSKQISSNSASGRFVDSQ